MSCWSTLDVTYRFALCVWRNHCLLIEASLKWPSCPSGAVLWGREGGRGIWMGGWVAQWRSCQPRQVSRRRRRRRRWWTMFRWVEGRCRHLAASSVEPQPSGELFRLYLLPYDEQIIPQYSFVKCDNAQPIPGILLLWLLFFCNNIFEQMKAFLLGALISCIRVDRNLALCQNVKTYSNMVHGKMCHCPLSEPHI